MGGVPFNLSILGSPWHKRNTGQVGANLHLPVPCFSLNYLIIRVQAGEICTHPPEPFNFSREALKGSNATEGLPVEGS